ncbi:signal peptidase I [Lactococcus taiwanensis]|uniref:Signal peptidase I n=1 Tax=Lactococcus taiwanensis TaxID=1151742 RepID=A0AA45QRJ2_9LACT|nr:signal peptidase I [Lactococcus taiwanensis]QSE76887.1 signal peptidase I [Lactococcus taiwanensis]
MIKFLKEWGIFLLIIVAIILSRIFIWSLVIVDGHSMDPTLADKERLAIVKTSSIDRFDIVVAKEETSTGDTKDIVKRVIGMPGDVIKFNNDKLTINNKVYSETYLNNFHKQLANGTLAETYGAYPLTNSLTEQNRNLFVSLAENTKAFTTDSTGNPSFTVTVPQGEYFLMGDNRVVSQDSRAVGTFKRSAIIGEAKLRIWPLNKISLLK